MRIKYNFLQIFRDKESLFWSIGFPMFMGVIFTIMFGGAQFGDDVVPVAIVVQQETTLSQNFIEVAANLEEIGALAVTVTDYGNAMELLRLNQVQGVVLAGNYIELMLISTGISENILYGIVNEFLMQQRLLANVAELRPEYLEQVARSIEVHVPPNAPLRELPIGGLTSLFYILLAMGCLAGSGRGLYSGFNLQARVTNVAARLSVAPTKKIVMFLENLFSTAIYQTFLMVTLMLFYVFVLGANFGDNWGMLILTIFAACFASVAFGIFFSVVMPGTPEKIGAYLMVVIYGSAIAGGLIMIDIRIMIRENIPFLDAINPLTLISDTFVALVLYEDLSRYFQQIAILLGVTIVCTIVGATALRRKSYVDL